MSKTEGRDESGQPIDLRKDSVKKIAVAVAESTNRDTKHDISTAIVWTESSRKILLQG